MQIKSKSLKLVLVYILLFLSSGNIFAMTQQQKDDVNKAMGIWSEYSTYTTALNNIVTSMVTTAKNADRDYAYAMDTLIRYKKFQNSPYSYSTVTNAIDFVGVDKINLAEEALEKIKLKSISKYKKASALEKELSNLGVFADTLSFATDLYSLVNNTSDFINEEDWSWKKTSLGGHALLDLYNVYSGSLSIMEALSTKVSAGTATKIWLNNPIAKGVSSVNSSTLMGGLGAITIGATIEGQIYKFLRDKKIETVTSSIFSMHQTMLNNRLKVFNKLLVLWKNKEVSSEKITLKELFDITNTYLVVRPVYSEIYKGNIYSLPDMFRDKLSKEYLSLHYSSDNFEMLRNDEKIDLMLDALVKISIIEDSDLLAYLDKTVTNGQTVADIIFGAFDSDIYEIYDTDDLKNKMFLYLNQSYSSFEYYNTIYKSLFHGKIAQFNLDSIKRLGKDLTMFYNSSEYQQESTKTKIFLILEPGSTIDSSGAIKTEVGNKVELIFSASGEGITDFVKEAFNKKQDVVLWYDDLITQERKAITFKVDDIGYTDGFYPLYFEAPSKEFRPIDVSYYDDDIGGMTSFGLLPGYNMKYEVSYEADNENSDTEDSDPEATEIAKKIGNHVISSTNVSFLTNSLLKHNDTIFTIQNDGITAYDISDKANPKKLSTMRISTDYAGDAYLQYPYIIFQHGSTHIIDVSDTKEIIEINTTKLPSFIASYGNYAYAGNDVYDISDIQKIHKVFTMDTNITGDFYDMAISKNVGYIVGISGYWEKSHLIFQTLNMSNSSKPILMGSLDLSEYRLQYKKILGIYNDNIFLSVSKPEKDQDGNTHYTYGILAINISNSDEPTITNFFPFEDYNSYFYYGKIIDTTLYLVSANNVIKYYDISDIYNIKEINSEVLPIVSNQPNQISIDKNYLYAVNSGSRSETSALTIFDISNKKMQKDAKYIPVKSVNAYDIAEKDAYVYIKASKYDEKEKKRYYGINILNTLTGQYKYFDTGGSSYLHTNNNYLFLDYYSGNYTAIYDISTPYSPQKITELEGRYKFANDKYIVIGNNLYDKNLNLLANINSDGYEKKVYIKDNILVINDTIYDISNPKNIQKISKYGNYDSSDSFIGLTINDKNYLIVFTKYAWSAIGSKIYNISDIRQPVRVGYLPLYAFNINDEIEVYDNMLFVYAYGGDEGLYIFDLANPENPRKLLYLRMDINGFSVEDDYVYCNLAGKGIYKFNWKEALENEAIRRNYYYPESKLYLVDETPVDYTLEKEKFTKRWKFDKSINSYDVEVISNTYKNKELDFVKSGNYLNVELIPNTRSAKNELKIKLTDGYGNKVTIGESDILWSVTKTNHAPRLADGQITQLVSATDEPAVLDIETYDGDGDSVTLSIKDNAGGTVRLNGNQLTASFTDGKTEHTIKVALSDGKERVIKEFHVLQFDSSSIKDFYSDVSANASYPFDGIAFGTLKGVIWGQSDSDNPLKRIFRPTDDVSMAEALAMIVNAEKKAGLITLESSNYYMDVYPSWAMPYYTFARDYSAISQIRDLASYYPTREEIAKIIVKTLGLEDQIGSIALENSFEDEEDFSSNSMLYYAKIARFFGLFMTETKAKPKEHINRAELAVVIEKIFMIPDANISFDPATVEYGDNLIPVVSDIKAQSIDSNYNLVDNSKNVGVRYIYNDYFINAPIDTSKLLPSTQSVKALISNQNVKRLVDVPVTITFTDQDHDGVQDREDKWKDDPRYAFDTNKNNIPDILDEIYSLSDYNVNSIVNFDGQLVKVSDIIRDGTYIPDLDGDGIVDSEDTDDDNDGISDEDEIKYGLNPRDASDAIKDSDGDGISNIDEIAAKTDPNDKTSYPAQPQKMVKVELKRGWNLMGMDTNLSLAEIKSLIGDDNLYIIQGASKTYKKEYVDNDQAFLNDFEKFEEGKGYWIKVVKDVTFEYPQVRSKNLTIPLSKGWNLINPTAEMPVKAIQDQIGMQHLFIIQGASKTYKKEYLDNGQEFLNDFVKFEEPKGYWIKVDQDTVLEFTE